MLPRAQRSNWLCTVAASKLTLNSPCLYIPSDIEERWSDGVLQILKLHHKTQTTIRVRWTNVTAGLLNEVTHFDNLIIELVHDLACQALHKVAYLHNYNSPSIMCSSIWSTVRSQSTHDHIIKHYMNQPVYIHIMRLFHNNLQHGATSRQGRFRFFLRSLHWFFSPLCTRTYSYLSNSLSSLFSLLSKHIPLPLLHPSHPRPRCLSLSLYLQDYVLIS